MSAIVALPVSAVFCTALLLFSPVVRAGPVRIVSQNRFVDAVAEEPGPRRQESREDASDFGPFNQRAQVTTPGAVGLATQDSMLLIAPDGALFTATGSATGSVRVPVHAESMFGVTFDVALPLSYRLNIHGDFPTGARPRPSALPARSAAVRCRDPIRISPEFSLRARTTSRPMPPHPTPPSS